MSPRTAFLLMLFPLGVASCAFGYYARGTLSDVPNELRGKAFPGSVAAGARFELADRRGTLRCDGEMAPPDTAGVAGACAGESGKGIVRCSDGRVMAARWLAISCRAMQGEAVDEQGNRLAFQIERKR